MQWSLADETSRSAVAELPPIPRNGELWDEFVRTSPGGDVVQTEAWGRSKRALGFEVCQVITRLGDVIIGGGQIVIRHFGPFGSIGYVARGPIVSNRHPDQSPRVFDEMERLARAKKVRHLIIQPPENAGAIAEALAARGYSPSAIAVAPTATVRLDLSTSLEGILAGMSQTRRRDVRRGDRLDLEVRMGERADIGDFFELHRATAQRQGFSPLSRAYLEHQWDALHPKGWLKLFLAYDKGRPTAGTWLTTFGDTVIERIQGWTGEGRNVPSNVSCLWHALQWAKRQGFRFYDLGGIDRHYAELGLKEERMPDEFHQSADAFKIRFGGNVVLLPMPSELTFNPLIRACGRTALRCVAGTRSWRNLLHRMRSK
jgi:lipid II:glycine glycyltransferase (peptidoglycan interpeptide bridge formation enzyme)